MIKISDILFAYDFDTTLISGGVTYLRDAGPLDLHLSLAGGTAPTRYTDGSYTFNGTSNILGMDATVAARFWSAIPDGQTDWCFICKAFYRAPAINDRIFSARTAGIVSQLEYVNLSTERLGINLVSAAGALYPSYENADVPLTGRTRVSIHSGRCNAGAVAPTRYYNLYDGSLRLSGTSSGTGVPLFDRTVRPAIGWAAPAGPQYFDGRLYYLALLKAIPTPDEVASLSAALLSGEKPWCGGR